MNFDGLGSFFRRLIFRQAIWLFPIAFILHVLEESPQFPAWASRYASPAFSRHDFFFINVVGIGSAVLYAILISAFPKKPLVVFCFAAGLIPAMFFNILFHAGATAVFGVYCPGLLTALIIYPPVFFFLSKLAYRERFLTTRTGWIAFAFAGVFHFVEVAYDVFKIRVW